MITKKVIVLMSFGGSGEGESERERAETLRQYYILQFKRLKYHIENITLHPNEPRAMVKFEVSVFETFGGEIPRRALQAIKDSDIVLGYISERNVNVIYELAVRNLLRDELVVVKEGPKSLIPIYLQTYGYVVSDPESDVNAKIRATAAGPGYQGYAAFEDGELPRDLRDYIDRNDADQFKQLKAAMTTMVDNPPRRPEFVKQIMDEYDPTLMITNSIVYYPMSMVMIKFGPKADPRADYTTDDILGDDVYVCDWNGRFEHIYGLEPDPSETTLWPGKMLVGKIQRYMDPDDFEAFQEDQRLLAERIILGKSFGVANVPLRFNDSHPLLPGHAFLPCVILKRRVGMVDRPHFLYFLVVYFDVTNRDLGKLQTVFK